MPVVPPPPPRYDHVVVVVLENINSNEILGNTAQAPYLNLLANQGAALTNHYGLIHTSAPSYGELFAGDASGIVDGVIPPAPFTNVNLAAELRQNGYTFAGYAQSLPSVGYTGSTSGAYTRGHNPWVNWQNDAQDATPNQLPSSVNLPFTSFPTTAAGFAQLPTVSFVIPDNDHNMHNGSTIAQRLANGDNFMKNSLGAYYDWAKANNSLLIVTADEDDRSQSGNYNQIPAIIAGANLQTGARVNQAYTLHNVLRTVEDMYALPHAAASNYVRPISGLFAGDAPTNLKTFTTARDTQVRADTPTTAYGAATSLASDMDNSTASGDQSVHALIRFDNLIGASAGQIPADATVLSAKLKVWTTSTGQTVNPVQIHRMLSDWSDTSTWNSLGGGVKANDVQAAATPDFVYPPKVPGEPFFFDVSDSVQRWLDGAPNYGWSILPTGADDFAFQSAEAANTTQRPQLEVAYALYPKFSGAGGSWGAPGNWTYGMPDAPAAVARFLSRATPATVSVDGSRTVGALVFDGPGSYTLNPGSAGSITLANYGNTTSVTVRSGSHAINAPVSVADAVTVDVGGGASLAGAGRWSVAAGKSLTKTGPGTFDLSGGGMLLNPGATAAIEAGEIRAARVDGQGVLLIRDGAVARLTPGSAQVGSRVSGLVLEGNARFDVGRAGLVVDYAGATSLSTVAAEVKSSMAGGWGGPGIGSSVAAGDSLMAVGMAEASRVLAPGAAFLGQPADATSILIRTTLEGDATLDGVVDFDDLVRLAQRYNGHVGPGSWADGDFNYDGVVDFNDLVMLSQNYNTSMAGAAVGSASAFSSDLRQAFAAVPEPGALGLAGALLALSTRRRAAIVKV